MAATLSAFAAAAAALVVALVVQALARERAWLWTVAALALVAATAFATRVGPAHQEWGLVAAACAVALLARNAVAFAGVARWLSLAALVAEAMGAAAWIFTPLHS